MKKAKKLLALLLALLVLGGSAVSCFAESTEETEPNNSKETATEYKVDDVATGSLSDAEDVDWYKVTLNYPGTAKVSLSQEGSDVFEVSVFDSSDRELINYTASAESPESPSFTVGAGEHYVKIKAGSVVSGAVYTLDFTNYAAENSESEDNNDSASANTVNLNAAGSGEVVGSVSSDDTDWFNFTASTGYCFCEIKKTDNGAGSITAEIIKTGSSQTVVGSVTVSQTGKSERSGDVGVNAGTYYVKVSGSGVYSLKITSVKSNGNTEVEPNNSSSAANPYGIDYRNVTFGSLSYDNDEDWYIVTTTKEDKNTIIEFGPMNTAGYEGYNPNSAWRVEFMDIDKNVIESKVAKENDPARFDLSQKKSGTYFFRVSYDMTHTTSVYYIKSIETEAPEYDNEDPLSFIKTLIDMLKNSKFWEQFKEIWENINILGVLAFFAEHIVGLLSKLPSLF